jgi:hypothetical protein
MTLTQLLRMARWARHPPSPARARLVVTVVALCFALWGVELIWGWPEALTINRPAKP